MLVSVVLYAVLVSCMPLSDAIPNTIYQAPDQLSPNKIQISFRTITSRLVPRHADAIDRYYTRIRRQPVYIDRASGSHILRTSGQFATMLPDKFYEVKPHLLVS